MNEKTFTPPKIESNTEEDDVWYFDNGASNHMTGVTPYEKFNEEKLNLKDLKVFGCVAYERIISKHLKKLDDRSKPLVYLGKELSSEPNYNIHMHNKATPTIVHESANHENSPHQAFNSPITVHVMVTAKEESDSDATPILSIEVGSYVGQLIPDPDKPDQPDAIIVEPVSKMFEINKKKYYADVRVMNYLLQGIPNDIYNSVDACKTAHQMWERIRRLMYGSEKTKQQIHSRLIDEFDKFVSTEGESLSSMYERITTLVNDMDTNQIRPQKITINTKFLNSFIPEEIQKDAQEDKITTAMMLLSRAITQHDSTPTNNRLRTSLNTRNQAVIQDGRVDIQSKNVGYAGNINQSAGRQNKNPVATSGNGMIQ
ncbi:hypothetical protein Tco_0512589 [Tanacetum coccineum]